MYFATLFIALLTLRHTTDSIDGTLRVDVFDHAGNHLANVPCHVLGFGPAGYERIAVGESNSMGVILIQGLPTKTSLTLTIPATDHREGIRLPFELESKEPLQLRANLLPRDLVASGIILHDRTFEPVSNARIKVFEHKRIYRRTGENGKFTIPSLAASDYRIEVHHHLIPSVYTIYPVSGGDHDIQVVLPSETDAIDDWVHPNSPTELIGKEAPPGSGRFIDEKNNTPNDLTGKPIWLRFFANYSPSTYAPLELLEQEAQRSGELILVHSASAWDKGLARWKRSVKTSLRVFMDSPQAMDREHYCSRTWARFGVSNLPTDILIGPNRRVVHVGGRSDLALTVEKWHELTN